VLDVYLHAGAGLAAAHSAGLVHRDFKPDNVLVGSDGRVKVTDFGLALHQQDAVELPPALVPVIPMGLITLPGEVLGTPAYAAPEQKHGKKPDARSDQFSFAVSLHEALYGHRPGEPHASPPGSGTQPPRRLLRALQRAVSDDPEARFPSMRALLDEL